MPGNPSDQTTLADFLTPIERQYGQAERTGVMARGISDEETLEFMR